MNITTVGQEYNRAKALRQNGNLIEAARSFLAAQRMASQCRSTKRHRFFRYAHLAACMMAKIIIDSDASHKDKSEAGQIKKESCVMFHKGI